jgi:hypothetical protein
MVTSVYEIRIFFISIVDCMNSKYSLTDVQYFALVEQHVHQQSKKLCMIPVRTIAKRVIFVDDKNAFFTRRQKYMQDILRGARL